VCLYVLVLLLTLQVLKRLRAYAKSSATLLTELIKGNEDDRKWLVRLTYHGLTHSYLSLNVPAN